MNIGPVAVIYGTAALLSLGLLLGYLLLAKKKELNFIFLFVAVFIVNLGYFSLSISRTLPEAMLANRIAYLGAVFLPLFMLLIIQDTCRIRSAKAVLGILLGISCAVFLLAASGGYCGLYYRDVSLRVVNGAAVLDKVYGPFHAVYPVYLAAYFGLMITVILRSIKKRTIPSPKYALILAALVLGNIAVWLMEQLADPDFEFLSFSYILTEIVLLLIVCRNPNADVPDEPGLHCAEGILSQARIGEIISLWPGMGQITAREAEVLSALLEDLPRKEIARRLTVSENTVKKHTSNIFAKLGVANRKELCAKLDEETPR